ncbi:Acyl-CoA dehydrogenase, N-terminal domain [Sphingomonas laterariae]|uniref:Acyl-CoA dehydrogenase, N-terminal domain n=1 Tax=Edaphosphingomonas laterariae TaxID=861865 RepID=A0A239D4I9_9SPHN|nr:acyl-CoA dehydrogenase family protein [Sphingomonas laterariae]SNS27139.1 Acyl-CoA dehydrogenase, N-terminal domain [Sphingomonas laterariae]
MDFRFTEDQITLRDSVREYLEGTHTPELLRKLDEHGNRDPQVWNGLVEMGLAGLLVPEDQGGLGMGLVEAALIAVELGRADVSEPIVDTAFVAAPWLAAKGQTDRLGDIAAGELKVALAHDVNPWIADLDQAGAVLSNGALADVASSPVVMDSVDPLRRLSARGALGGNDPLLLDLAALMSAAQLIGAADRMLALSVDYAQQREQFGQPIGSFQAVKHHAASVAVKVEFAKPVLWRAAYALQNGHARAPIHISHAKLAATDAAIFAAETAIQIHGAMGYTYEVDLHFWMKRAWALAGAWGDRTFHLKRIDDAVIGGGIDLGPDRTFASEMIHA